MAPPIHAVKIEMTPEVRERVISAVDAVLEALMTNTRGPSEAFVVLQMVREGFSERYGFVDGFRVPLDDKQPS